MTKVIMNFFSWIFGESNDIIEHNVSKELPYVSDSIAALDVNKKLTFVIGKRCAGKTTLIQKLVPGIEPFTPGDETDRIWLDNLYPIPWNDPQVYKSVKQRDSTVIVETQSLDPTPPQVRNSIWYLFVFPHISASEINRLYSLFECVYDNVEAFSAALDECKDYECLCLDLYKKAVTKIHT